MLQMSKRRLINVSQSLCLYWWAIWSTVNNKKNFSHTSLTLHKSLISGTYIQGKNVSSSKLWNFDIETRPALKSWNWRLYRCIDTIVSYVTNRVKEPTLKTKQPWFANKKKSWTVWNGKTRSIETLGRLPSPLSHRRQRNRSVSTCHCYWEVIRRSVSFDFVFSIFSVHRDFLLNAVWGGLFLR